MAVELPYLPSYKNVAELFKKIETAAVPDIFTQKFLAETIGLKGSGDRALINLLKNLDFLEASGKPTQSYSLLKNKNSAGIEIAKGVRSAYQPLFKANEKANELNRDDLKGLVAQVAGSDTQMTSKIVGTFTALKNIADFSELSKSPDVPKPESENQENVEEPNRRLGGMRPEFHYNLQIQLPAHGTEETYINIFNAVRKVFQ